MCCGQHRKTMSSCMGKSRSRNPYAAVQVDPDSAYITPGTLDLEQLFWTGTTAHYTHFNEVWPDVYIGDECVNLRTADVIVLIQLFSQLCQKFIMTASYWVCVCINTGKLLWSGLVWRNWGLHISWMQQRESGIMCWLVLSTTETWKSSIMV